MIFIMYWFLSDINTMSYMHFFDSHPKQLCFNALANVFCVSSHNTKSTGKWLQMSYNILTCHQCLSHPTVPTSGKTGQYSLVVVMHIIGPIRICKETLGKDQPSCLPGITQIIHGRVCLELNCLLREELSNIQETSTEKSP